MSEFDPEVFAASLVQPVKDAVAPFVAVATAEAKALIVEVESLESDVEATMAALQVERSVARAQALHRDLEMFLPARKDAIIAQAVALGATDLQGALEAVLTVVLKAAVIVGKSFIPVP